MDKFTKKIVEEVLLYRNFDNYRVPFPSTKKQKFKYRFIFRSWAFPIGRAFRYNLFARSSQKGFPLQSLTQNAI